MGAQMAYVGKKSCGCATVAVVDEPTERAQVGKRVAEYIQQGYAVERVTVEEARLMLKRCDHKIEDTP